MVRKRSSVSTPQRLFHHPARRWREVLFALASFAWRSLSLQGSALASADPARCLRRIAASSGRGGRKTRLSSVSIPRGTASLGERSSFRRLDRHDRSGYRSAEHPHRSRREPKRGCSLRQAHGIRSRNAGSVLARAVPTAGKVNPTSRPRAGRRLDDCHPQLASLPDRLRR